MNTLFTTVLLLSQFLLQAESFYFSKREAKIIIAMLFALIVVSFVMLVAINIYRKSQIRALKKVQELSEKNKELQTEFVMNMTHEVRTPLNAILGFTTILSEVDDLDADTRKQLQNEINLNKESLLKILNDILDFSQLTTNSLEFQDSKVDVNRSLSDICDITTNRNKNSVTKLEFVEKESSCFIQIDKDRFSQVIMNFLSNAYKYTQEGSIKIGYRRNPDKSLYFYVSDTGCGIPADKQKDIFQSFVKVNYNVKGSGLGLSLCKAIIEHYGGGVGVQSKPGQGALFYFTLPGKIEVKAF